VEDSGPYRSGSGTGICPRCSTVIEPDGEMGRLVCANGCGEWYPRLQIDTLVPWTAITRSPPDDSRGWPWGGAPCPICRREMAIRTQSDLRFDLCATDGIWLDAGEYVRFLTVFESDRRSSRTIKP
jgi:Zn-finger nucleic acid-binding protein